MGTNYEKMSDRDWFIESNRHALKAIEVAGRHEDQINDLIQDNHTLLNEIDRVRAELTAKIDDQQATIDMLAQMLSDFMSRPFV